MPDASATDTGAVPSSSSSSPAGGVAATVEDLVSDLRELPVETADSPAQAEVATVETLLREAHDRGLIGSRVRHLDVRDAAEAFVGSVIVASPLLVEDGIYDIADYLFQTTVSGVPVFLVANTLFTVLLTYALMEWTGRNTEETAVVFGVVPIRLVMTLLISFVVATVLMTVWGRVDGWASPVQALARITVIWTVGSLGAALGDIIANDDPSRRMIDPSSSDVPPSMRPASEQDTGAAPRASSDQPASDRASSDQPASDRASSGQPASTRAGVDLDDLSDTALLGTLHAEFETLQETLEAESAVDEVERLREETIAAALGDGFGETIQKYTSRDVAEGFVGSVFFAIPFLVEDGVFDVANYFLAVRVTGFPVFFLANTVFVLFMILALVYWAGPQDVRVHRAIFGFVPRRLVGIAVVSFLTAGALMTMWGRVAEWHDPVVALARISVVWTVASFGASLGDILPGESSGGDITDELDALTD